MTHVVTENCILCKHTDCVGVCPVDCFRETPFMLVIDPDECIDCGVCIPECPVGAIYCEEDLSRKQWQFIGINAKFVAESPAILRPQSPLPNAATWREVADKASLLSSDGALTLSPDNAQKQDEYFSLVTAASLTPEQWEAALSHPDDVIRRLAVNRPDFVVNRERLDHGLQETDENARADYVLKSHACLNSTDIDKLLDDPSPLVRLALFKSAIARFTPAQIERALNDVESELRLQIIKSPDFVPTAEQFFHTLQHGRAPEVQAMLRPLSADFLSIAINHPAAAVRSAVYGCDRQFFSKKQFKIGLQDPEESVRYAVACHPNFRPTASQFAEWIETQNDRFANAVLKKLDQECIDVALNAQSSTLLLGVIENAKTLTDEHIKRCLVHPVPEVALAAFSRAIIRMTPAAQIELAFQSPHVSVHRFALQRHEIGKLSSEQFAFCLSRSEKTIRAMLIKQGSVPLSAEQAEQGLTDPAMEVRYAVVSRPDFLPTVPQYQRGINDKSKKVAEEFSRRYDVVDGAVIDLSKISTPITLDKSELEQQLRQVLDEINQTPTWTKRKHKLAHDMCRLLNQLQYTYFSVAKRDALLSRTGEHMVMDVPLNKRGHLQPMRGKKVHLVCTGQGPYITVDFAVKALT